MFRTKKPFIFLCLFSFALISCTSSGPKIDTQSSRIPANEETVAMNDQELLDALVSKNEDFEYSCGWDDQTKKEQVVLSFLNNRIYTNSTFLVGQRLKEAKEQLATNPNNKVFASGNYRFIKRSFGMYMLDESNKKISYVYDLRKGIYDNCRKLNPDYPDAAYGMEAVSTNIRVASLVGPFLSLHESSYGYAKNAAHPYVNVLTHAFDARFTRTTDKPSQFEQEYDIPPKGNKNTRIVDYQADLLSMVTEDSLIAALKADPFLNKKMGNKKLAKAKSLQQIVELMKENLESCEIAMPKKVSEALSQFSVYDYREGKDLVSIRLGFSYGCEAARGTYTKLGLIVKPTEMFRKFLQQELQTAKTQNRRPYFGRYLE